MSNFVVITPEPLDVAKITDQVVSSSTGAISTFIGTTRDHFEGKKVVKLEYEAYTPMAEKELVKVCSKIRSKWSVKNIAIYHRLGMVKACEASVIVAISSEHRKESLEAVHFAIDDLKAHVPIWKKEVYEGDTPSEWKQNKECTWAGSEKVGVAQIDLDQVQVKATSEEINRRIDAFMAKKRDEINSANVLEFCNRHVSDSNSFSCARQKPDS